MRSRGSRSAAIAAVLTTTALAIPAVAFAVGSIQISAPATVTLNHQFKYTIRGNSPSRNNRVATFPYAEVACKSSFREEKASPRRGAETSIGVPKGAFTVPGTATSKKSGTHYICTYLYYSRDEKTLARASHRYVTNP
jgi:hypothetical protein